MVAWSFPRTVRTTDIRVLAFLVFVMCLIVTFTSLQLLGLHRYAVEKDARPFLNTWVSKPRNSAEARTGASNTSTTDRTFCNNAEYDFPVPEWMAKIIGPWRMVDVPCAWYEDWDVVHLDGNGVGFVTNVIEATNNFSGGLSNMTAPHFVLGMDTVAVSVQHGVYHETIGSVFNPATDVVNQAGEVIYSFAHRQFPSLSLAILKEASGLDLSQVKPQEHNFNVSLPMRYRNGGVQVSVDLVCTNRRDWSWNTELRCRMSFQPLTEVWGMLPSAIMKTELGHGAQSVQRIGVKFVIHQRTTVYVTELNSIIAQFSAFVSLALVGMFLTQVLVDRLHPDLREYGVEGRGVTSPVFPVETTELGTDDGVVPVEEKGAGKELERVVGANPMSNSQQTQNDPPIMDSTSVHDV